MQAIHVLDPRPTTITFLSGLVPRLVEALMRQVLVHDRHCKVPVFNLYTAGGLFTASCFEAVVTTELWHPRHSPVQARESLARMAPPAPGCNQAGALGKELHKVCRTMHCATHQQR